MTDPNDNSVVATQGDCALNVIIPPRQSGKDLALPARLPVHVGMKPVDQALVDQVIANAPMPHISRDNIIPDDDAGKREVMQQFLRFLFPQMADFAADFSMLDYSDAELDNLVEQTIESYRQLNLTAQVPVLQETVNRFKSIRGGLKLMFEANLIRPDSVLPMECLPDLFMAVPVWYFWTDESMQADAAGNWNDHDPHPHDWVKQFCDLFPNQVWAHTFQLFNRRLRTLRQYEGDVIPPQVARRMQEAAKLFDHVVIATPYHDEAGKDWEDLEWQRSIDPYVLGFKKGIPYFFVLARFSDSGTFPLFNELLADTVDFLRTNKSKLSGFDMPTWYHAAVNGYRSTYLMSRRGGELIRHVDQLLAHFDAGTLFDWLRGDDNPQPHT